MRKLFFGSLVLSFLVAGSSFADSPTAPTEKKTVVSEKSTELPSTRLDRSEFTMCRSEIENESTKFYNIGSMCADGLFALMEGRGCENIVHETAAGGWTYHYCAEADTCDRLHNSVFVVASVDLNIPEIFPVEDYEMWCMDNNYAILRQPIESDLEE